jgi:homeobox protein cut-like
MSKLEALLLDKNRKMEHELTQLKVGFWFGYWKLRFCCLGNSFSNSIFIFWNWLISCVFKVKISEKTSLLEEAEKRIAELTSKVEEQQKLILKLEDDILKVISHAPLIALLTPIYYSLHVGIRWCFGQALGQTLGI